MVVELANAPGYTDANFVTMRDGVQKHFDDVMAHKKLFKIDCDMEEMWNLYLDTLPDDKYKENRWHDCTACRRWFRKMANVVALTSSNKIITLWSGETIPEYQEVFKVLNDYLLSKKDVYEVFYSAHDVIGIKKSYEELADGTMITHNHFFTVLPHTVVKPGIKMGQEKAKKATNKQVFQSSLDTISMRALNDVIYLIEDNNLYRGQQWLDQLKKFKGLKQQKENVDEADLNNWYWIKSMEAGSILSRIKNHSIGVLLTDLSKGMDLEIALKRYESVVAPSNYQRPKEIFTERMLEEAREKIKELGYEDSLKRRYAVMEDLSANDVIFVNRDAAPRLQDNDIFGKLLKDAIVKPKEFNHVQTISLKDFVDDIVPNATNISLYTSLSLHNNFVSLIAPENKDAPSMFKWDNAFSWAYKNNMADSMKEQVKEMGGDIDVDLRFSIRWNNTGVWDKSDLDAHCTEPMILPETGDRVEDLHRREIFYHQKISRQATGGYLDVDIIDPRNGVPAVENIRYKDKSKMIPGEYVFRVHQFNARQGNSGFEAEVEFDDQIYRFSYLQPLKQDEYIPVAKVILHEDGRFEMVELLDGSTNTVEAWGVKMNTFVPVNLVCYSPNYWGDNAIGNQHVFFMLQDCKSDDTPNAWYNEFLDNELKQAHKNVMEALGRAASVEPSDNQLSGIGFAVTRENKATFKITNTDGDEILYNVVI